MESEDNMETIFYFQAVVEEPSSPQPIKEEIAALFGKEQPPSPARSTTSSSSGSYDLEDAIPGAVQEPFRTASLSGHASEIELDREVNINKYST